jgi:hypothetical protein
MYRDCALDNVRPDMDGGDAIITNDLIAGLVAIIR